MIKLPAAGADGKAVQGRFALPSPSPGDWLPEPVPVADAEEEADDLGAAADMFRAKSSATAGDSTGALTTTGAGTLRGTEGMANTDTVRARLFRFELFFLADTPVCMVNSTTTTDIAMIDIRTGLTIFDSPLATASFQAHFLAGFAICFIPGSGEIEACDFTNE